jgi:hypothetical protein
MDYPLALLVFAIVFALFSVTLIQVAFPRQDDSDFVSVAVDIIGLSLSFAVLIVPCAVLLLS